MKVSDVVVTYTGMLILGMEPRVAARSTITYKPSGKNWHVVRKGATVRIEICVRPDVVGLAEFQELVRRATLAAVEILEGTVTDELTRISG